MTVAYDLNFSCQSQDSCSLGGNVPVLWNTIGGVDEQQGEIVMVDLWKLKPSALDENRSNHKLTALNPGEFDIIRPIGQGSHGTVFEARWLGTRCALKIFAGIEARSFKREKEIMACLKHPHIVQILGYSVNQRGFFYLLMELMATNLRIYMDEILGSEDQTQMSRMSSGEDQGPFKLAVALDIMLQVAEALEYMHINGMVHRDVKSPNILVSPMQSPEGYLVVKLADFGVSKFSTSHQTINVGTTSHQTINEGTISPQTMNVGTVRWMAPEVFDLGDLVPGTRVYPYKADVYSFAITSSEILTGQIPFGDNSLLNIRRRIMKGLRPTLPTSLPPQLVSLIEKCWDGDPSRRPDFSEICMELTSLKSVHTITGTLFYSICCSCPVYSESCRKGVKITANPVMQALIGGVKTGRPQQNQMLTACSWVLKAKARC
jgi:serine/threonine protein kinase